MRELEAHSTLRRMAAFYQCVRPDPSELDMISTRVMDIKLRETAEGLGEDSTGKKKSKFKTFKKFFGKKKRKESPSSTESSTWKQSQTRNEVIAIESGPAGYDSEDELEESRATLGSRALSHDSIFIPESGQDPTRPVRVFSQENVCDRIKALQLKIQCNVKMGPPPPPGGLPAKRGEDAGMSSEDDGLPRSPPEMSLLHDVGPGTTIKVSVVSPDHVSDSTVSARTSDSSLAPVADFRYPPESSSCLDNSAAKHKLQVKPRNQRSSKMRRLSSRAQSESLSDLTCTPEEEENEEKPPLEVSPEESPSSGQQDVAPDRGPEPGPPVPLPPPGGVRARRARLRHSQALRASLEEEGAPGEDPSSRPATPELAKPESEAAATPGKREPCPAAQEPAPSEDRNPFPVKLRSTSLSLKYRDGASQETKGVKRYSAEVRLERSLTVLPKEEKCPLGTAPALRGARAPSDQGKGKARSPEPLSSKPPLPRKPLLQSFTLPHQAAPPDTGPGERDPRKEPRTAEKRSLRRGAEKSLPPAATGPGADGQPVPPWITVTRQKRRGTLDQPPNQEDKPGTRTLKSEPGKQAKVPERQEPVKQADFVRSKSFLITPVKPAVDRKQGAKLNLKEGLQRGISLSHQNLAQSAVMMEKELHQLKRASYASTDQPSWMELARKKSQAWSDMPQIIK
ncbi:PREDICTED: uncharacterized protein KIAA1211-like homolog [Colobus angolensis palliatus]|uniref:uncharacterized protein KIAA1211-like homolog n=1 Tax=Colobus angolensis palliatus TaxID=336983 RepID=UPI0005F4C86C|nr:PREDICTED: uncharacterized protein KIAA1211-like homolog [Colobus angolensis palliatus]